MKATFPFGSSHLPAHPASPPRAVRVVRGVRGVRGVLALATALACLSLPSQSRAQWDDFNDGNDSGWTRFHPLGADTAEFTYPAGGYRMEALVSPNPAFGGGRVGSVRADATYTNFYVAVDLVNWNTTADQAIGIVARLQQIGLGTTDGYAFTAQVADQDVSISRITDERPSDVPGTSTAFPLDPARDYRLVFLGRGSHLEGRIYDLTNLITPILTIAGTDTVYTVGVCGLIVADLSSTFNGTGDATFDNYVALDVEPPRLSFGIDVSQFTVSWPLPATYFNLQEAPVLPSAIWTMVPTNLIVIEGTNFIYRTLPNPGNRFFRLQRPMD